MRKARMIREARGLSLEDVVRGTPTLSLGSLGRFERGLQRLRQEKLLELSEFLGVTINELLEEVEPIEV